MRINTILICLITICISNNAFSQDVDTLNLSFKNSFINVKITKHSNYKNNAFNKFIPFYIFSDNKNISNKLISYDINTLYDSESLIYIEVDFENHVNFEEKEFAIFFENSIYNYINKNYRTYDYSLSFGYGDKNNYIISLMKNNINLFDYILFFYDNYFTTQPELISELKHSFATNKTQKKIDIVSYKRTGYDDVLKFDYYNFVDLNIHYIWFNENEFNNKIDYSRNLYHNYVNKLCNIDFNLVHDDLQSSDYYFNQLNEYINLKRKLVSNRNLNELAYYSEGFNYDFAINLLNYAMELFPYDLNLYHSLVDISIKSNKYFEAKKYLAGFKEEIESNKSKMNEKLFNYWQKSSLDLENKIK